MNKYLFLFLTIVFSIALLLQAAPRIQAAECQRAGECVDNKVCNCTSCGTPSESLYKSSLDCGSTLIGGVTPPEGVRKINNQSLDENGNPIGLIIFISKLLNFSSIIAGIIIMFNVLFAGFTYITSAGDAGAYQKIMDSVTWSLVGMVVIISAYAIAGIVGTIFFGDPTFILQPKLDGAI